MALFKDFITTKGQRMLARMLTGEVENLEFTRVVLGDGENKNPEEAIEVTSPICEAAIEGITLSDNNVLSITAEFTNEDMESGFYMREKGLYLSDGSEEVLAIYANAGSTASYIEPAASGLIKKVIRSSIVFSQADIVNVTLMNSGYANAVDFEEHVKNKENPHDVTAEQVGLGNVPNVATNDQTVTYETAVNLTELTSGEKLATGFGKLAKAVKDLITHIADSAIHFTATEREKLKNIAEGANKYTHPSYTARTGNPTANQAPAFGETFTVTQLVSDATGHITAMNSRTVTIPNTAASASVAGLMSAADKKKLEGITESADSVSVSRSLTSGTKIGTITINGTAIDLYCQTNTDTDTKNTAGSTNTSSKIFLIGATSQAANPQTYSHDTAYVGADGHLYSNGKQVVNLSDTQALTNKTYNGYTLAAACAKTVTDSSSASVIGTGTSLVTERDVHYGLPTINASHSYSKNTNIYAPTSVGTSGYTLQSSGSGAPTWVNTGAIVAGLYSVNSSGSGVLTFLEAGIALSAGVWLVHGRVQTNAATGRYTMETINATENATANGAAQHLIDKTVGNGANQSLEWMDIIDLSSAATIYPACVGRPEADATYNGFTFVIRAIRIK